MELFHVTSGHGAPALFIHGSAADHTTWTVALRQLAPALSMVAYDRRGTGASPGGERMTMADHARDAAELIDRHLGGRAVVIGSSFGAVVAIELARRRASSVAALVLCEPPLSMADELPVVPSGLGCAFDRIARDEGGERAAEHFLRAVLGSAAVDEMPAVYLRRACAGFQALRADFFAMAQHRPGFASMAREILCPVLLCGGGRSVPFYADTLDTLELALPQASRVTFPSAGHMLHVEAHKGFHAAVLELVDAVRF